MKKFLLLFSLLLLMGCENKEQVVESETAEQSTQKQETTTVVQENSTNDRAAQAQKELDAIFLKYSKRFEEVTPVLIEEMKTEIGKDTNNLVKRGKVYSEKLLEFGQIFLDASQEAALVAKEYGTDALGAMDNWTRDIQQKSGEYKKILEKAYNDLQGVE